MSESLHLLDTSLLLILARGGPLGQHIDARFGLRAGRQRPLVCVVSHGEVWVLARRHNWGEQKQATLRSILENVVTVDINHPRVIDALQEEPNGRDTIGNGEPHGIRRSRP